MSTQPLQVDRRPIHASVLAVSIVLSSALGLCITAPVLGASIHIQTQPHARQYNQQTSLTTSTHEPKGNPYVKALVGLPLSKLKLRLLEMTPEEKVATLSSLGTLPQAELIDFVIPLHPESMRSLVRSLRDEIMGDPELEMHLSRVKQERLIQELLPLVGKVRWSGPSGARRRRDYRIRQWDWRQDNVGAWRRYENHFASWMHHAEKVPGERANMNCWQVIFLAAYRAGLLSSTELRNLHERAANFGRLAGNTAAFHEVIWQYLNGAGALPYVRNQEIDRGDMLIFGRANHVAIYLGSKDNRGHHEMLSLEAFPNSSHGAPDRLQITTVEDYLREAAERDEPGLDQIKFTPVPWPLR